MKFDLLPLDGSTAPAFTTAVDCKRWMSDQTLTNHVSLQRVLCEQLGLLNRWAVPLRQRFNILEVLHPHIVFVQEEAAKRFAGKPLPHLKSEAETFAASMRLWQVVTDGYLICLEDADAGSSSTGTLATLVQCALSSLHERQLDCARGLMLPDAKHWARVHKLLAFAEDRNIVTLATVDTMRYGDKTVTPLSVYAEAMLLHAVSATEFSSQSLRRVVRWARNWSGKMILRHEPPPDLRVVPMNVDLDSSLPPGPLPAKDATRPRFLDTTEIAAGIKFCLAGLTAGRTPEQLGLGDDCSVAACEAILQRLYQCWCRGGMQRPADRKASDGTAEMAVGAETIWFHLAGRPFKQPRTSDEMLRREREELAAFGHVTSRAETQAFDMSKLHTQAGWQVANESPSGLRLMHALNALSVRVGIGQLVALRKPAGDSFFLASVRWLMQDPEGGLHAGMKFMTDREMSVTPVSFRIAGVNAANEPWRPAFYLEGPSLAQMVLPPVVFRVNRVIEIEGGPSRLMKLTRLIERSDDFEKAQVESV